MKNEDSVGFKWVRAPEDGMTCLSRAQLAGCSFLKYGGTQCPAQRPGLLHIQSQSARPRRRDSTLSPIASNKSDTFSNKYVVVFLSGTQK